MDGQSDEPVKEGAQSKNLNKILVQKNTIAWDDPLKVKRHTIGYYDSLLRLSNWKGRGHGFPYVKKRLYHYDPDVEPTFDEDDMSDDEEQNSKHVQTSQNFDDLLAMKNGLYSSTFQALSLEGITDSTSKSK